MSGREGRSELAFSWGIRSLKALEGALEGIWLGSRLGLEGKGIGDGKESSLGKMAAG